MKKEIIEKTWISFIIAAFLFTAIFTVQTIGAAEGKPMTNACEECHKNASYQGNSPHIIQTENKENANSGNSLIQQSDATIQTVQLSQAEASATSSGGYTSVTLACISCHNDTIPGVDTDGNGIIAPYKRPHNDTIMCEYCHGSNPHIIRFIQPDGTLGERSTAATCIDCHQTGTVPANNSNFASAYVMGNPLHHSTDPKNGSLWNRTGESPFWTSELTACIYCHNDSKHDIVALGKPSNFKGSNTVRTFGTWCTSCHYQGDALYNTMIGAMAFVPPEITMNNTYGNYASLKYYDHSGIGSYQDTTCVNCHGDRPNVSALMHNVNSGGGGPNCVSCHDVGKTGAPKHVNVSAMNGSESIHANLNIGAITSLNTDNKRCWACHGNGTQPTKHPDNYKTPYTCIDCHVGSNANFTPNENIPRVSEHYWNGDQIKTSNVSSCYQCHNKSEMMIFANDPDTGMVNGGINTGNDSVSHYGKKRSDLSSIKDTRQYCDYCHNSTTSPSTSFYDVFTDINNRSIQNHSAYPTGPKCQDCHSTGRIHNSSLVFEPLVLPTSAICLPCHGQGGTASINNRAKHNGTVDCSVCHMENGKEIHPIKYLNNTNAFSRNRAEGIKCDNCHETGKYNAPAIGKIQHSVNTWNGSLWNAGRASAFWNNNTPYIACEYCHGNSKHNSSALGKLTLFQGINSVDTFGNWCGTCHYKGNVQYNNMKSVMNLVPPEITKDPVNGDYVSASDGTPYFEHVLGTYSDVECNSCHSKGPAPNLTTLMHKVEIGGTSCLGCHSTPGTKYYVDTTKFVRHANVNVTGGQNIVTDDDCKTCHFNVLTLGQMKPGYANHSNTWFCQDCHTTAGTGPVKPTDPALIKDGTKHGAGNCEECHIAGDNEERPLPNSSKYHYNGPKGTAFDTDNNMNRNCYSCHYRSDGVGDIANSANLGLNSPPFNAPIEDHQCANNCHEDYTGFGERPPLSACSLCHGAATIHNTAAGDHQFAPEYPIIDTVSITTPVSAGTHTTVRALATSGWVQMVRAQYRIMDNTNTAVVRDWQDMSAQAPPFDKRAEFVVGSIDTSGLFGTYTINIRAMDSGHVAQSGGIPHNGAIPYYPDNGVWTRTATVKLQVTASVFNNVWAGWTQTSGASNADPSITVFNNKLYATVKGTDNRAWVNSMDTNGIWAGWSDIPNTGSLIGVSNAQYNNKLYEMAVAASDNTLWVNNMDTNGVWAEWSWIPGLSNTNPSMTVFNNKLYATVKGTDNRAWVNSMDTNDVWAGWNDIPNTGSLLGVSASTFNGKLYILAVGLTDNSIWVNNMDTNGIWGGWSWIPGLSNSNPSMTVFNNKLYVTVKGTDNSAWVNSMDTNGVWAGWGNIPNTGSLIGISNAQYNNKLYEMVVGTDYTIWVNNLS